MANEPEVYNHVGVSHSRDHALKIIEALSTSKGRVQDRDVGGWREVRYSRRGVSFRHSRWPGQVVFDREYHEEINPRTLGLP